jgi:hypothetical protein
VWKSAIPMLRVADAVAILAGIFITYSSQAHFRKILPAPHPGFGKKKPG